MALQVTYENLLLEQRGTRVWLTFNRPAERNALTHAMMEEIGDAIQRVREEATARVLILRGAGGNFSAGGDLNAMQNLPPAGPTGEPDPLFPPYRYFGEVLQALDRLPLPVIALVEGGVAGGGVGMACCADVTIVRDGAIFALPEPKVGFIPSQIIPFIGRRIGSGQLRRWAILGQRLTASEAVGLGIGHYLAESDRQMTDLLNRALAEIDRNDPAAMAAVKDVVLRSGEEALPVTLDAAADHLVRLLRRPEAMAGMRAFLSKQEPPWIAEARKANEGAEPDTRTNGAS